MNITLGTIVKFSSLSPTEQELVETAWDASSRAWAHFPVGAAILAVNAHGANKVFQGGNVANKAFSATMCAEQNAVTTAVQEGFKELTHVAVVCRNEPGGSPCGICRQVLCQYARPDAIILSIMDRENNVQRALIKDLLPGASGPIVEFHDLSAADKSMVEEAVRSLERAYVPYSHLKRGAIVSGINDGGEQKEFCGSQIDNASYPASVSAEKSAIAAAVSAGFTRIVRLAVASGNDRMNLRDASIDGESLQVIREFGGVQAEILLVTKDSSVIFTTVGELLPDSFGPDSLGEPEVSA